MVKFLIPILLLGLAGFIFFSYASPLLDEIKSLRVEAAKWRQTQQDAAELRKTIAELTQEYNSITSDQLAKLNKLMPDQVDGVGFVVETNRLANRYGMKLSDVKVTAEEKTARPRPTPAGKVPARVGPQLATAGLSLVVEGAYPEFRSFLADLEQSLRLSNVSGVTFSTAADKDTTQFKVELKTYWLK